MAFKLHPRSLEDPQFSRDRGRQIARRLWIDICGKICDATAATVKSRSFEHGIRCAINRLRKLDPVHFGRPEGIRSLDPLREDDSVEQIKHVLFHDATSLQARNQEYHGNSWGGLGLVLG